MRMEVIDVKANYEKPKIEFEEYQLDTAIATGCGTIVDLGPEDHEYNGKFYTACSYFGEETFDAESPANMNFFETCSCYLSAGGGTVFTS